MYDAGAPYVARKIDVFNLGVIAFALTTGRKPFGVPRSCLSNALNRTDLQGQPSIKAVAGTAVFWERHLWISGYNPDTRLPRIYDFGWRRQCKPCKESGIVQCVHRFNPYDYTPTIDCFHRLLAPWALGAAVAEEKAAADATAGDEHARAPTECGGTLGGGGGGDSSSAWSFPSSFRGGDHSSFGMSLPSSDVDVPPAPGGPVLASASLSDGGVSFCGGYADTFEEERVVVLGNKCIMPAPDGWSVDRLAEHLRGMPGVAIRANNDGVVEGEVEPPVNLVFTVAHDAAAATFTFMRHTGERMDLAELVYEVDAAVSA